MKCCITGHTRGIGLEFYNHFKNLGWDVEGFSKSNGYELSSNYDNVLKSIQGSDLFINNSYADGYQIKLFNDLLIHVKKMIVCGSIASDFPDPTLPKYSLDKLNLEKRIKTISNTKIKGHADILLLKLTSTSYKDYKTLLSVIDFWLENPSIMEITFRID